MVTPSGWSRSAPQRAAAGHDGLSRLQGAHEDHPYRHGAASRSSPTSSTSCVHTAKDSPGSGRRSSSLTRSRRTSTTSPPTTCSGEDPSQIERHAGALRGYVGPRRRAGRRHAPRRRSTSRSGICCGKALGQPLHDLLGGRSRDRIRTYNTCAGDHYVRGRRGPGGRELGTVRAERRADATRTSTPSCTAPDELARSLLDEGTTGMKIWPFDPYAEATPGHDISTAELDLALEPIRQIRAAVGHEMDVMVELHALWDVPPRAGSSPPWSEFDRSGSRIPCGVTSADALRRGAAGDPSRRSRPGETLAGLADFRDLLARDGARIVIFDVGWVGGITDGAQGRGARRGLRAAGGPARLHGTRRLHRGDAHVAASAERDPAGERARVLGRLVPGSRDRPAGDRGRHGVRAPGPGLGLRAAPRGVRATPTSRIRSTSEEYAR